MKKKIYLLVVLFLGLLSSSFAQKGRYHVRFTVKTIDCSTGKAVIALQVKASTADSTFLMGDANYRFDYDPRVINNPTIISQENYSSQAPASDLRYGVQNLNGSTFGPTKGTVSLNTIIGSAGTGAALVTTNWTTVSCIQFDIVNTQLIQNNCFSLVWHTNTDFPTWMPRSTLPIAFSGRKITGATRRCRTKTEKGAGGFGHWPPIIQTD